jgi:dicarboxylate/amino acid:cation (Na+ or H+) symporter, DAACS family
MSSVVKKASWPLWQRILTGLVIGSVIGASCQVAGVDAALLKEIVSWVRPLGELFMRMIFMVVIPLLISALVLGVSELGDIKRIGRIGLRCLMYTVILSLISVAIGLALFAIFKPGAEITVAERQGLMASFGEQVEQYKNLPAAKSEGSPLQVLIQKVIPKNPVEDMARAFDSTYRGPGLVGVMIFALFFGVAMAAAPREKVAVLRGFMEGLFEVSMKIIGYAMQLAPFGIAALMFSLTATIGLGVFAVLAKYVLVVLLGLALHLFGVYSLVLHFVARVNPLKFFRSITEVMLTAFSTSSSNATLPTSLRVANDKLGIQPAISSFVLTLGSTANQNGTALYEGITVLFLATVFGVDLTLTQQFLVVLVSMIAGLGVAGVPGGSLPMLAGVLVTLGIPGEAVVLIYGVDRILDMSRTVLNVTGDLVLTELVNQSATPTEDILGD